MNRRKIASLQIWNNEFYIFPVLSFIDAVASRHKSMDISRYHQLRFVVGEIIKRRITNAYPGGKGELYIELFITESYFEVSVNDMGVPGWHDFSYDKNNISNNKIDFANYIMDNYVDEIGMEKLGSNGQRIFIRKKIINPVEFVEPAPYPETQVLDTNITIHKVESEEDVIEAIRCIYSEYGYSYSYERLYYVDSFMDLIKSGEVMSFLAVNDHGQTAGHFALVFSDLYKNMPEVSTVVIRKEFRGLGLFSKFMTYCEEVGNKLGFRALMGQPVTFHPMSQKAFLRAGYTASSLLMSYLGSEIESEYNKNNERLGLSACVKILDKNAYSKIYPPKNLVPFVKNIYDRIALNYDISENPGYAEHTQMYIDTNKSLHMTKIVLREAAKDYEDSLKRAVKDAIRQKSEMIELVILLNSPSCEYAYTIAAENDFVFSGIIPGAENGDYIIMQMLPGDEMKYDNLVTVGEFDELKQNILSLI